MDMGFVDWSSENVKFIERDRTAVFPVVSHLFLYRLNPYLLDDKEYIALVVD